MAAPIDLSTSPSLEQQAYEIGLALVKAEAAIVDNPPNNAQVSFDTEANTVAIAISLNTTLSVTNGNAVIAAKPYLI